MDVLSRGLAFQPVFPRSLNIGDLGAAAGPELRDLQ